MADGLSHNRKAALDTVTAQISGAHTDFPVLFTAANLPSEMFDSDGSFPAQNGGGDIRFTSDSASNNDLPCEVVSFVTDPNPANGSAEIWVKLPNVRDTQVDTIYVWYNTPNSDSQPSVTAPGGRNAVWSPDYHMVVHGYTNGAIDSAGNVSTPTEVTGDGALSSDTGQIGDAIKSPGEGSYLDYTNIGWQQDVPFTFSAWLRRDYADKGGYQSPVAGLRNGSESGAYETRFQHSTNEGKITFKFEDWNGQIVSGNDSFVNIDAWGFVALAVDTSNWEAYSSDSVGFFQKDTGNASWPDGLRTTGIRLAKNNGAVDEFRIAHAHRSSDWLTTEYNNQNDPGAFISVGTPESAGGAVTVSVHETAQAQTATQVTLAQVHDLVVDNAGHGHVSQNTAFDAVHDLEIRSGAHGHTGLQVDLGQLHGLSVLDAGHGLAGPSIGTSQYHFLEISDGGHGHADQNAVFSQTGVLVLGGGVHTQVAEVTSLIQQQALGIASLGHLHTGEAALLLLSSAGAPAGRTIEIGSDQMRFIPQVADRSRPVGDDRVFPITTNR